MYKLNMTEIELRKETMDETRDHVVHGKNGTVIDNKVKDDTKGNSGDHEDNDKKEAKRFITVDAVKRKRVNVRAEKDSLYDTEKISGVFIDKLK